MPVPNGTGLSGFPVVFAMVDFLELVPGFCQAGLPATDAACCISRDKVLFLRVAR